MEHAMKERLRTIAVVIALVASGPTLTIAVGNWNGYLGDDWAVYAVILISFFGLPASTYLVTSYCLDPNIPNIVVIDEVSPRSIVPSGSKRGRTKLRLVSST
jgi:hypothetical protein